MNKLGTCLEQAWDELGGQVSLGPSKEKARNELGTSWHTLETPRVQSRVGLEQACLTPGGLSCIVPVPSMAHGIIVT